MAEVYRFVQGQPIQRYLAGMREVQYGMRLHVDARAHAAAAILASHRYAGDSRITVERGDQGIDWYVYLDDERGLFAARTIEFGRRGNTTYKSGPKVGQPVPPMEAVAPLRKAFGLTE